MGGKWRNIDLSGIFLPRDAFFFKIPQGLYKSDDLFSGEKQVVVKITETNS